MIKTGSTKGLTWVLTVFMFVSFFIFDTFSWGRYVLFLVAGIILVDLIYKGRALISIKPFHTFLFFFGVFCALSALWGIMKSNALEKGITILSILLCYSILYMSYQKKSIDALLKTVMWGGYAITLYTIIYYKGMTNIVYFLLNGVRFDESFQNSNVLGMVVAMACIIQIYYLMFEKKSISALLMIPSFIIILVSQSRKSFILLLAGSFALLLYKNSSNKRVLTKIFKIIATIIVLFVLVKILSALPVFGFINGRLEGLWASITGVGRIDHSSWLRKEYRRLGMEQFFRTPLLGIGIDSSSYITSAVEGRATYLHSNYVELLACGGIVGFVFYYSMYLYLGWTFFKYRKYDRNRTMICIILMILLLVMDYGMVSYYSKSQYFYLLMFFIQAQNIRIMAKEKNNGNQKFA